MKILQAEFSMKKQPEEYEYTDLSSRTTAPPDPNYKCIDSIK
jgi:hypothetical protein